MGFWKYVLGTPRNYALTFLSLNEALKLEGKLNS